MSNKKLIDISFMKTLMMIVIVLYHSCLFFGGSWFNYVQPIFNGKLIYKVAIWFNTFHVQTFTMASGFLFYYLKLKKNNQYNVKQDIKKRFKRLVIPYIFTCIFWVIPIYIFFFGFNINYIFIKYILMISPSQLWFLIMLFLIFIVFELLFKKIKISTIGLFITYIICTSIGFLLGKFSMNYFQYIKAIKYVFYFYLGGYLYLNQEKISLKQIVLLIIIMLIIINLFLVYDKILNNQLIFLYIGTFISSCEICFIYYICKYIVYNNMINTNNKVYKLLEENSFGIYLFHQQIIYFAIVFLNGVVNPIFQVLLSFIIAISISLIISCFLKKNRVTRIMFGL